MTLDLGIWLFFWLCGEDGECRIIKHFCLGLPICSSSFLFLSRFIRLETVNCKNKYKYKYKREDATMLTHDTRCSGCVTSKSGEVTDSRACYCRPELGQRQGFYPHKKHGRVISLAIVHSVCMQAGGPAIIASSSSLFLGCVYRVVVVDTVINPQTQTGQFFARVCVQGGLRSFYTPILSFSLKY